MKLLGKEIDGEALLEKIETRLRQAGELPEPGPGRAPDGVEPPVDPISFNLAALEEHADPTRPLPLATHRGGVGRAVLLAKWAFRRSCQVFINETLGRQRLFNSHSRDAYAQLSAEVLRLRAEVAQLRGEQDSSVAPVAAKKRPAKQG